MRTKLFMALIFAALLAMGCDLAGGGDVAPDPPREAADRAETPAAPAAADVSESGGGEIASYKIKFADGSELKIKHKSAEKWKAKTDSGSWSVKVKDGGAKYKLIKGDDAVVAEAKLKDGKLKFKDASGNLYFKVKIKDDKLKVYLEEEGVPWEIKFKEDKVKVVKEEAEHGKVKYYPDNGKLKAKDKDGNEVASMKEFGKLSGGLAPFLMSGLNREQQTYLALLVFAMGK